MLKATLYFAKESKLSLQISENSEVDLGFMPHLGCNSCACSNCQQVKTVNYYHKELGLRYYRDPISSPESYNSQKHFSTKTPQTNGVFSLIFFFFFFFASFFI